MKSRVVDCDEDVHLHFPAYDGNRDAFHRQMVQLENLRNCGTMPRRHPHLAHNQPPELGLYASLPHTPALYRGHAFCYTLHLTDSFRGDPKTRGCILCGKRFLNARNARNAYEGCGSRGRQRCAPQDREIEQQPTCSEFPQLPGVAATGCRSSFELRARRSHGRRGMRRGW